MNLTVYTQNVYEPYATSHFKAHSLLATGSIVAGIVRIVSYPLLAKLANVRSGVILRKIVLINGCSILVDRRVLRGVRSPWPSETRCTHLVATSIPSS